MRLRSLTAVLAGTLVGLCAALAPADAGAGVGPAFVGLTAEDVSIGDADYRAEAIRGQAGAGAGLVRLTFDWARIEHEVATYDFEAYDREVANAAEHGVRILPVLANPPRFRQRRPSHGARRGTYPPVPGEMAHFADILVRRYGPGGFFFDERPELPHLPIRSWQIWNEPNLPVYWAAGPNPRGYVRLLRAVGGAIRAADPGAEIVSAGLPQSRQGMSFERFVTGMYKAGGRGSFDTLAVHPYARTEKGVIYAVKLTRSLARRYGDRRRPVWVTEIGWSTAGPRSPFKTSPKHQAARIGKTMRALARRRAKLRIRGVVYYNWRDYPHAVPRSQDFFGLHTGLLWANGTRKPGYYAFANTARALR